MRILKLLYYICFDAIIAPIFNKKPYWNSKYKKYGSWSDYWFITSDDN